MTAALRAVADVGSNSARLLVVRASEQGHLDVVADARVALRLMRDVDEAGRLGRAALQRTVHTLQAFGAIARRHGARNLTVVATSAIRDAVNRDAFVAEASRRSGHGLTVLEGTEEARLALIGAVSALPVESGTLADLGGGSLELATFVRRRFRHGVTLPLGALRLGGVFLRHDPPRGDEVAALRDHVRQVLSIDGTGAEAGGLVGTGGTVRALAKAARGTRPAAVSRLHGYELRRRDVTALVERLVRLPASKRSSVPGISSTRAESILAGALVVEVLLDVTGSDCVLVSGYGVRQGVVLDALDVQLARPRQVREASVNAVLARLRGGDAGSQRRRQLVLALAPVLAPRLPDGLLDATAHAARLVDAGARLDHYGRWSEAASLVTTADLDGFAHSELATTAAVLLVAGEAPVNATLRRASGVGRASLEAAGTLLALADDIDRRLPPSRSGQVGGLDRDGRLEVAGMPTMLVPVALAERCGAGLHRTVRQLTDGSAAGRRRQAPDVAVEFK